MDFSFSDVVGIAGLYFALVSLLGSIFFFSLSQWLSDILGNIATWNLIQDIDPDHKDEQSRLNCYHNAKKSSSFVTLLAWSVISVFLVFIEYNIFLIYLGAEDTLKTYVCKFVLIPSIIFLAIYLLLSTSFIIVGYKKAKRIIDEY